MRWAEKLDWKELNIQPDPEVLKKFLCLSHSFLAILFLSFLHSVEVGGQRHTLAAIHSGM
jgi:hypothetical protein